MTEAADLTSVQPSVLARPASWAGRELAKLSIARKLGLIIGIFLLIAVALLSFGRFGMNVLSDVRAYVGGESLWSKAQKDAVYHLMRYAILRNPEDYRRYRTYLAVPLGDRKARQALEQPRTDFKDVEVGFIEGRNHPKDVRGMARLFKHFHFIHYIRDASNAWREGDRLLGELMLVGEDAHRYVQSGEPDNRKVRELLARIDAINDQLTPIEERFSYTLGEGARWLNVTLLGVMLATAGLLLLLGLWVAVIIAQRLASEIDRLRHAAARIAEGDFSQQVVIESSDEVGDLARSFQVMARQRQEAETALAQRAHELDEANRRLIETERLKDNFFATVSHELRTPLTLVLSPLESLLAGEYGALPASQRYLLQTMHNNTVRLLQMVTGLLDFSKLEAGRMEVHREPTKVASMTRAILADFEALMKHKGLTSQCDADPPEAVVLLDRYLYERIVFNLLANAVKFTPAGGTIAVTVRWAADRLRVAVRDTGIGIAAADQAQLFQKFRQLEGASTRRFEGTGLGLALVKEFTALLEGTVAVDSAPGQGSTFTIECAAPATELNGTDQGTDAVLLPRAQRFVLAQREELAAPPAAGDQEQPRVLVAEDNHELAIYIAALLQPSCQVALAKDGEEALGLAQRWHPDLVLSDVMMPRRDGLSLCRALKQEAASAHIPVILLTALTYREAMLKGWEAGADEYLFKPFHPKELVTRVTAMLANVRRRRRVEEERHRIFNLSLDLLSIAGFDGYFKQLNPQWERLLGFTDAELRARPYLEFIHPKDQAAVREQAEKLAAGQVVTTLESRLLCKDGAYKWLLWNAVPLPARRLIYVAARDITERIHAEQQLKAAHTDLKKSHEELKAAHLQLIQAAKMESVGRLAAGVAHEVKNPLAVILQGVDYISRHLPPGTNGPTATVLKHTENAVHRADAVIRGLLDFSTTRELERAPAPLNDVLEQALLLVKHELDRAHIALVREFDPALPLTLVDRNKIEQVLVNLCMNAVHAMPGGGTLTLRTRAQQLTDIGPDIGVRQEDRFRVGETVAIVHVEDTGPGIPEDQLERVFDPFFTTKPTGQGTGLGLTVAKKIIELHHGMIALRNREAGGLQVTVVLKTGTALEGGGSHAQNTRAAD